MSNFCVAGINYRKSDIQVRGKFSLSQDQCEFLLRETISKQIPGAFVLSTCNRTEIYGISLSPRQLIDLLCLHTQGTVQDFIEHGYTSQGIDAVEHLFKVAAGLDSQIIGDYEILAQLKHAAKTSRQQGCLNNFLEKIVNFALQSSKEIKTKTHLSSGTVSVSYAAIEIIKERVASVAGKKVLLIGTGKIGHHIAGNLKTYLPQCDIAFCNRTNEKAQLLAAQHQASFIKFDQLPSVADAYDIIIVSAGAENFIISRSHFKTIKPRLVLDLSVPQNVDPAIAEMEGIQLMNVDEISAILDKTIHRRKAEIPQALRVIARTLDEVKEWFSMQLNNPMLLKVKLQLHELSKHSPVVSDELRIHKAVSSLAIRLRQQNNKGCQYIHTMNDYLHMN